MAIVISKPCIKGNDLFDLQTGAMLLGSMMRDEENYSFPIPEVEISLRNVVIGHIDEAALIHLETYDFKPIELFSTFSEGDYITFTAESKHCKESAVVSSLGAALHMFEEYNNDKCEPALTWDGFKQPLDDTAHVLYGLAHVFGCAYRAQLIEERNNEEEGEEL